MLRCGIAWKNRVLHVVDVSHLLSDVEGGVPGTWFPLGPNRHALHEGSQLQKGNQGRRGGCPTENGGRVVAAERKQKTHEELLSESTKSWPKRWSK